MKSFVKKFLVRTLPEFLKYEIKKPYLSANQSCSQEGEDVLLKRIFDKKESEGFYVDIGAHDPIRFSNTYSFYLQGWKGINIDPFPGSSAKFKDLRPNDISLEVGISSNEGKMRYYMFEEHAFNTFSKEVCKMHEKISRLIDVKDVPTLKLSTILDKYCRRQEIDFMSIDVEGFEIEVLESNNWTKYSPKVVIVEDFSFQINKESSLIGKYMQAKGYRAFSKLFHSVFYINENHLNLVERR